MSEVRLVSPMLDNFALGDAISNHNGVRCYPAMRTDSEERYIVKTISIPASQVQLDALLLTGAYPNAEAAKDYFKNLANGIRSEIQVLDKLSAQRGFLPYLNHQIVPMEDATGYDVYMLSPYKLTLERHLRHHPLTHLSAVNMGIDLCAALTICRENGYLYVDLKPENIVLSGDQNYHIADLGFISLNALKYSSLPDRYRSRYTPPEITDAFSTLNTTMDTYALGLVLYQVFNNGELPPEVQPDAEMVPPVYADYEMAEIILKAIAINPEERWTDPTEMGKALIAYMQRNTVNDVLIGPPVVEEPEPEPEAAEDAVEEPAEEASSEAESAEPAETDETDPPSEQSEDDEETAEASEGNDSEEAAAEDDEEGKTEEASPDEDAESASEEQKEDGDSETPADGEDAQQGDWIDVMQNIIAEDGDGAENADEPPLRELLGDNGDSPSGEEADENAPVSEETAGILNQAQELIDHETPEPVVAPDPIDVPMPEPIVLEDDVKKEEDEEADKVFCKVIFSDEDDEEESEDGEKEPAKEASSEQTDAPAKKKRIIWKKVAKVAAALVVVCGLLAGAYYYYIEIYRQAVSSFTISGEADTLVVNVESEANPELLTVVCKDTYGNVVIAPLTDGSATFTQLKPATQYTITLEIEGFHKLVGMDPLTYSTPARTQILNMTAVTGTEDGSVILNFAVEGPDSEEWTLSYSSENTEPQSVPFTGHTVTVSGLTIGETYTFTLAGNDSTYLIGENSIEYTVRDVVLAQNLTVDSYSDNTLNVSWTTPEGEQIPSWTAHCYNEEGYDQVLQVETNSVSFPDISSESAYTVEVVAQGMTQAARMFVTANPISVKNLNASVSGSTISLSWEFEGKAPEGGWTVLASVDGSTEQQTYKTEQTSLTVSPVAPGSHYTFVIQAADSSSVFGGTASVDVPAATADFSNYGLNRSQINVFTYHAPEKENWRHWDLTLEDAGTTFRPGEKIAVLFYTSSIYQISGEEVTTLVVFRDAEGKLAAIDSRTKGWSDMWESGYSEMECDQVPTAPGTYTMEVYLNNAILATSEVTISE